MKIYRLVFALCLLGSTIGLPVLAQTTEQTAPTESQVAETPSTATTAANVQEEALIEQIPLQAQAGRDKNVAIGRNVTFDGSGSTGPLDTSLTYTWDFGDGQNFDAIKASHIYNEPGTYKATLTVSDGVNSSKDSIVVSVAKDVVILITDTTISKEKTKYYKQYAQRHGTLMVVIRPKDTSDPDYIVSRNIAERLITSSEDLSQADLIISWTEKNTGLNALSEVGQIFASGNEGSVTSNVTFGQKAIVRVDEKQAGSALARLAQNTFNIVKPKYILLTTSSALETILTDPSPENVIDKLKTEQYEYEIIGSHSQRVLGSITPLNAMSYGINYLINQGVSPDSLFLLLILPIVATIIAFGRQVVGIRAFGIYVPSIITLTFVTTELKYGLIIFLVLLITATLTRLAARRLRLLYMPRMAIVLSVVAFAIFLMLIASSYLNQPGFLSISIFPILVMIILTEKFVEAQIEQGQKTAIILTIETLVLAIVSYMIVTWDSFETFLMAYPEVILLTLLLNLVLGRFTGLRLFEYIRFQTLFKKNK